jgi:UDP-N-acetylglucosamine--N-acetylmuramyl-(pentapeptide) pyrophosphoryl-undecaprenol N-acetylglucosamine transferase
VASVLVPFPFAVDDHQTTNAAYLSDNDAAILIQQTAFTVDKSVEVIKHLTITTRLTMAKNARALAKPEATETVANICAKLAGVAI